MRARAGDREPGADQCSGARRQKALDEQEHGAGGGGGAGAGAAAAPPRAVSLPCCLGLETGGAAAGSRGWVSSSWPPQALRPQTQEMFGLQTRLCGSGTTARQTSSWSFGTNRTNIKTQHKCSRTQGCDKGQCSDSGTSCAAAAARLAIIRLAAAFVRRFIYARNGPVPATTVGGTVL